MPHPSSLRKKPGQGQGPRPGPSSSRGMASNADPNEAMHVMDPYAGLTEHQRETAIIAASATLDKIAKIQGKIRNKDGKIRRAKFIAACLAMRYEGFTPKETAENLGCSWQQVTYALMTIRKDASLDAQVQRLNDIAVPLAMDNAIRGVMDGDKEYTMRVLDGAGVFKSHQSIKGEVTKTIQSLSVVLEVPAHLIGKELPMPKPGSIMGAPTMSVGLPPAAALEGVVVRREAVPVSVGEPDVRD